MIFFLTVAWSLFILGLANVCHNRNKNIILFLLYSEILFLGLILLGVGVSLLFDVYEGFVFSIAIIICTVSESVLGLSLSIAMLKTRKTTSFYKFPIFERKNFS